MTLSFSLIENFEGQAEADAGLQTQNNVVDQVEPESEEVSPNNSESSEDCMVKCRNKCESNVLDEEESAEAEESSQQSEEQSQNNDVEEESEETFEGFSNMNSNNVGGRSLWSLDLLLKAVLFACLFYVLAHSKTRAFVSRHVVRNKEHGSYVLMLVFALVYYLLHLVV